MAVVNLANDWLLQKRLCFPNNYVYSAVVCCIGVIYLGVTLFCCERAVEKNPQQLVLIVVLLTSRGRPMLYI